MKLTAILVAIFHPYIFWGIRWKQGAVIHLKSKIFFLYFAVSNALINVIINRLLIYFGEKNNQLKSTNTIFQRIKWDELNKFRISYE